MSKIILFLLLFFITAGQVFASDSSTKFYDWSNWNKEGSVLSESTTSAQATIRKAQGLLPDNPFYFFKPLAENLSLAFTFDLKAKEEKRLAIAEERLAETEKLLEKKKYDLASKNLERYQSSFSKSTTSIAQLKNARVEIKDLITKVELYSAKHSLVLERLEGEAPEELKDNIKTALAASRKGMDKSADELGKPPVTEELKGRLESLKALGILTSNEVASILTLGSREEVRKRLEDLASQDLLPKADVKKVDEAQRQYFPNDYTIISEQKKLEEFSLLEKIKPDEQMRKRLEKFKDEHKKGEPIPADIQKWWAITQRYEELRATLRPELVPLPTPTKAQEPKNQQEPRKQEKPKVQSPFSELSPPTKTQSPASSPTPTSTSTSTGTSQSGTTTPQFGSQCTFGPHAIGTIFADGSCYYLRCEAGWYNNDLDVNNGCESSTDASVTPAPGTLSAGICGSGQVKNAQGECVPENQTCTDTNSAVPFYTTGSCTDSGGTYSNYCEGSVSKDFMCEGTWDPQTSSSKNHRCVVNSFDCSLASTAEPYSCSAGACVKNTP